MPNTKGPPPHILIFVPGYLGSALKDPKSGERVWLNLNLWEQAARAQFLKLKKLHYPSELVVDGIYDGIIFVPQIKHHPHKHFREWILAQGYQKLSTALHANRNYYAEFAYDWRQDNRISARELGRMVAQLRDQHPGREIWLIAHSNGGLVTRWFIEQEGGKDMVHKQILLGVPRNGTPKAFRIAYEGLNFIPLGGRRYSATPALDNLARPLLARTSLPLHSRDLTLSFPSIYQLFPLSTTHIVDQYGREVDIFDGARWLPPGSPASYASYLMDGRRFSDTLGDKMSVETFSLIGEHCATVSVGVAEINDDQRIQSIAWYATLRGDGTIPLISAHHPKASKEILLTSLHGEMCTSIQIQHELIHILRDRYLGARRSSLLPPNIYVTVSSGADYHAAAALARVDIDIHDMHGAAVPDAIVTLKLINAETRHTLPRSTTRALHVRDIRWQADVTLPTQPGYYELSVGVDRVSHPTARGSELICVVTPQQNLNID